MKSNSDELEGIMIDGLVKFSIAKSNEDSMKRSNISVETSAPHRMGGGVCHDPGISIPRNAMRILGGCRLLDYIGFHVCVSEQVVASLVKT